MSLIGDDYAPPVPRPEQAGERPENYGSTLSNFLNNPDTMGAAKAKLGSLLRPMSIFRSTPASSLAVFIFLPWLLFTVIMAPFALAYSHLSVFAWVLFSLCVAICLGVLYFSTRNTITMGGYWLSLGVLCLVACVMGLLLGLYDYYVYVFVYHSYELGRSYLNVLPVQDPGAMADASILTFSQDAFVDSSRSVGYQARERFCVAPILSSAPRRPGQAQVANYWAVGQDCCKPRGRFVCGPIGDPEVRSGLRVQDPSPLARQMVPIYMTAVEMAVASYGLSAPENPILVKWSKTPEQDASVWWQNGLRFYRQAVGIYIGVVLALGLLGTLYLDSRRTGMPSVVV